MLRGRTVLRVAAFAAVLAAVLASVVQASRWTSMDPRSLDVGIEGSKGYREPALFALTALPPGTVVGALQSGALMYYASPSTTVVNLDGVVDRHAHRAIVEGRRADYAHQRNISWFVDWPFNRVALGFFSPRAAMRGALLQERWWGPLRGTDRTVVWSVDWRGGEHP